MLMPSTSWMARPSNVPSSRFAPNAIYTAAEQTVDFGAPQTAVTVRVYQLSATYGRGAADRGGGVGAALA